MKSIEKHVRVFIECFPPLPPQNKKEQFSRWKNISWPIRFRREKKNKRYVLLIQKNIPLNYKCLLLLRARGEKIENNGESSERTCQREITYILFTD